MLALFTSLLFLLYFSIVDYLKGEILATQLLTALLVQFSILFMTGSVPLFFVAIAFYGVVFQWGGLWGGADTIVLWIMFLQNTLNPFLLLSMTCLSLVFYILIWEIRYSGKNPRLVPAFFLALVLTSIIYFVSVFPTSI